MAEDKNPEKLDVIPITDDADPAQGSPYGEVKESKNARLFSTIRGKDSVLLGQGSRILLILLAFIMVVVVIYVFMWLFKDFAPWL